MARKSRDRENREKKRRAEERRAGGQRGAETVGASTELTTLQARNLNEEEISVHVEALMGSSHDLMANQEYALMVATIASEAVDRFPENGVLKLLFGELLFDVFGKIPEAMQLLEQAKICGLDSSRLDFIAGNINAVRMGERVGKCEKSTADECAPICSACQEASGLAQEAIKFFKSGKERSVVGSDEYHAFTVAICDILMAPPMCDHPGSYDETRELLTEADGSFSLGVAAVKFHLASGQYEMCRKSIQAGFDCCKNLSDTHVPRGFTTEDATTLCQLVLEYHFALLSLMEDPEAKEAMNQIFVLQIDESNLPFYEDCDELLSKLSDMIEYKPDVDFLRVSLQIQARERETAEEALQVYIQKANLFAVANEGDSTYISRIEDLTSSVTQIP